MKKLVRIGTLADQDRFRREDYRRMSPNRRVEILLDMQSRFLNWDKIPMPRIATIRRIAGKPHAS